jgi:hypothetical protein
VVESLADKGPVGAGSGHGLGADHSEIAIVPVAVAAMAGPPTG